jgi:UDP-N-acetylglucosamine 2-epimerase (non-hydrolysing)
VLVIRLSTERPEAVEAGFAKVVGTGKHQILTAIKTAIENKKQLPEKSPFGDGNAAEKTTQIIKKELFTT